MQDSGFVHYLIELLLGLLLALVAYIWNKESRLTDESVKKLEARVKDAEKAIHEIEKKDERSGAEFVALARTAEETKSAVHQVGSQLAGQLSAIGGTLTRVATQTGTPPPMRARASSRNDPREEG